MRARTMVPTLVCGFVALAVLAVATPVSAHHPPAPVVEVPDLTLRQVFVIAGHAGAPNSTGASAGSSSSSYYQDPDLSLSNRTNQSSGSSKSYTFRQSQAPTVCFLNPCSPTPRPVKGVLPYVGDDYRIEPSDNYSGQLRLSWSWQSNSPAQIQKPYSTATVNVGLHVSNVMFEGVGITLSGTSGSAVFPLDFHQAQSCDSNQTQDSCVEGDNSFNATEEIWTHDVILDVSINPTYGAPFPDSLFGTSSKVSVDTAGSSFMLVHEFVPAPPVTMATANNATANDTAIDGLWQDTNGDGQPDAFAPGPSPWLLALGLAGALGLSRRLRA